MSLCPLGPSSFERATKEFLVNVCYSSKGRDVNYTPTSIQLLLSAIWLSLSLLSTHTYYFNIFIEKCETQRAIGRLSKVVKDLCSCSERQSYFTEWMTLFDWLGLLLILCIIPFRYIGSKAQWIFASLAVLFNFLRIFKFSCVTRKFTT